jgi:hypothetical protein
MRKIHVAQLRVLAKPHAFHHNPFKMANHVIGQEKRAKRGFHFGVKFGFAKKHLITMWPSDAGDIFRLKKVIKRGSV